MGAPVLQTARLTLRALEKGDALALHPVFADAAVMRYWSRGPHQSFEDTVRVVASNTDLPLAPCWAITTDGAAALGWVNLRENRTGVAETGYILGRAHWGQGFAREALAAVIAHGFGPMDLRRIVADTDPDNLASVATLRALGFTLEGHLRDEWKTHLGVRDSLIFGLLAREWRGRR